MKDLTLKEKIGQMIGLAFYGTDYNEELKYQIEEIGVGLVIYFKDNCASPEQIFNLNKIINNKAKIAPFISLDQEGGMVARVTTGVTQSPGAMAISATRNPHNAYDMAYNMGVELRKIGFNLNFAPVGDINNNPKNPVINVYNQLLLVIDLSLKQHLCHCRVIQICYCHYSIFLIYNYSEQEIFHSINKQYFVYQVIFNNYEI